SRWDRSSRRASLPLPQLLLQFTLVAPHQKERQAKEDHQDGQGEQHVAGEHHVPRCFSAYSPLGGNQDATLSTSVTRRSISRKHSGQTWPSTLRSSRSPTPERVSSTARPFVGSANSRGRPQRSHRITLRPPLRPGRSATTTAVPPCGWRSA